MEKISSSSDINQTDPPVYIYKHRPIGTIEDMQIIFDLLEDRDRLAMIIDNAEKILENFS